MIGMWLDLDQKPRTRTPSEPRPRRRMPLLAVVALVSGALGGLVATVANSQTPAPTYVVRFAVLGDGQVDYAALVTAGRVRQVASVIPHRVHPGTTAVLTIRSIEGATCQITVDGVLVDEADAGGGNSATCLWTV